MNTTHNTRTKLLRLATAAVATPTLLFAGAGTAQADPGDASTPLVPQPQPAAPYEPYVPEESVSHPDLGMTDANTPSVNIENPAKCAAALTEAAATCAGEFVPGVGQVVDTPMCIGEAIVMAYECGAFGAIRDKASDIGQQIANNPYFNPSLIPYRMWGY